MALKLGAVSSSGAVLSLPQSSGFESSLTLLKKNYKLTNVFFWGKISGTAGEYLIAMGTEESYTKQKFFYWCAAVRPCLRRARALMESRAPPRALGRAGPRMRICIGYIASWHRPHLRACMPARLRAPATVPVPARGRILVPNVPVARLEY